MNSELAAQLLQAPPFIRTCDMPRYFGISERSTWKLIAQEEIDASRRGRHWLINSASVFKFLKKHRSTRKEDRNDL